MRPSRRGSRRSRSERESAREGRGRGSRWASGAFGGALSGAGPRAGIHVMRESHQLRSCRRRGGTCAFRSPHRVVAWAAPCITPGRAGACLEGSVGLALGRSSTVEGSTVCLFVAIRQAPAPRRSIFSSLTVVSRGGRRCSPIFSRSSMSCSPAEWRDSLSELCLPIGRGGRLRKESVAVWQTASPQPYPAPPPSTQTQFSYTATPHRGHGHQLRSEVPHTRATNDRDSRLRPHDTPHDPPPPAPLPSQNVNPLVSVLQVRVDAHKVAHMETLPLRTPPGADGR